MKNKLKIKTFKISEHEIESAINNSEFSSEKDFFSFMSKSFLEVEKMIETFCKWKFELKNNSDLYIKKSSINLNDLRNIFNRQEKMVCLCKKEIEHNSSCLKNGKILYNKID